MLGRQKNALFTKKVRGLFLPVRIVNHDTFRHIAFYFMQKPLLLWHLSLI